MNTQDGCLCATATTSEVVQGCDPILVAPDQKAAVDLTYPDIH